jgi:CheY-like chemotaxis protein
MHTVNTALARASLHGEREHRLLAAQQTALELATTGAPRDEVLHVLAQAAQTPLDVSRINLGRFELQRREGNEAVLRVTDDGIGLTLARRLVQMHDGRITASSEGPGRGSTFEVRLPLAAPARATQPGAAPEPGLAPTPRRVLVADDNVDAAESLCMLLQIAGHEVRCAHDGVESVRVAEQFRPEVVLLDIGMPRLNGYGAARQIRALPDGPSMLLIALTGWGQDEDKRLALDAGFDRHLTKPVEPEALMALVQGLAGDASTTA